MNDIIIKNYEKIEWKALSFPVILFLLGIIFLYWNDALTANSYVEIQKEAFYFLNEKLSQYPDLQNNITQLGDAFVILSLLSILWLYAPRLWEALLFSAIYSLIFSGLLKEYFDVPRPVTAYGEASLVVIGQERVGFSSFPSGHSITVFASLVPVLFAFLPQRKICKILFFSGIIGLGLIFTFSRVAVGAHHPLDVLSGAIIGSFCAILGIISANKYRLFRWVSNEKYYFVMIFLFFGSACYLIYKIYHENLLVFYISLCSLVISEYLILRKYVKK